MSPHRAVPSVVYTGEVITISSIIKCCLYNSREIAGIDGYNLKLVMIFSPANLINVIEEISLVTNAPIADLLILVS